ncbi:MAG: type II secretion system F family protein [Candidatus Thorarchaeota archaeon]
MLYEQLCRFSSRIPLLSNLGFRREDRELSRAVGFLEPFMHVTVQGVVAAAYLTSFGMILGILVILLLLQVYFLVAVPLAALMSIITYHAVITYPVNKTNSYKLGLSEEADLVFEQFVLVFQADGTIFDAIEMVAQSQHPYLSPIFQGMILRVNEGVPPETCLSEFARNQPSDDLRRYITGILSALERKTELLDLLSGESFEADMTLRQRNLELESRLLVVAALATYIPIMLTLAVSLSGYATNPMVLLLVPLFLAMNLLLKNRFSSQFSSYFDRPNKAGVFQPSQREIVEEYDEFLNFLMLLGERLRFGDTLEVAITEVRNDASSEVQQLIDPAINSIYWGGGSSKEALSISAGIAKGQRVSNMLKMIPTMCEVSAVAAGERITRIAARLVQRSAVAKERESIIAAQRLKVYLLSLTSSAVLGLLTALSPFLFIGALLGEGPILIPGVIDTVAITPLFLFLFVTTLSTGYMNTQMVGGRRPVVVGAVSGLLYWVSLMLASMILGLQIV